MQSTEPVGIRFPTGSAVLVVLALTGVGHGNKASILTVRIGWVEVVDQVCLDVMTYSI
jgi:hypothetical protein